MIACVWDYYGSDASGTALHFEKHLKEFIQVKHIQNLKTGTQINGNTQSFVWCAGKKEELTVVIEVLKPKHYIPENNFKEFGITL
ncbi:hypothetical protein [Silvanigrella aquatica]|uniref:Uncharacterized protein n=1 Tax=Silvanigrella aquatica TaxID=1915309 RepID=A0A1L4D3T6_9BACT|nr:hypothetical protein [Silvanigrella aquatica]APJ04885.1 hypothetical protein AXG55_13675 [Silvanigrella aquatica]